MSGPLVHAPLSLPAPDGYPLRALTAVLIRALDESPYVDNSYNLLVAGQLTDAVIAAEWRPTSLADRDAA